MLKKILLISFVFFFCQAILAQEKVEVTKEFLADANKAFELLAEYRTAIDKFKDERKTFEAEKKASDLVIKNLDELVLLKDKIIKTNEDLVLVYQKIIQVQNSLIDLLEKQISKPKPLWKKILNTVKEVALIVGGITIGRTLRIP